MNEDLLFKAAEARIARLEAALKSHGLPTEDRHCNQCNALYVPLVLDGGYYGRCSPCCSLPVTDKKLPIDRSGHPENFYGPMPEWDGQLSAKDFPQDVVEIEFDDGSECKFYYAFYRYEKDRLVVYTEHCGYHSFNKNVLVAGIDRTQDKKVIYVMLCNYQEGIITELELISALIRAVGQGHLKDFNKHLKPVKYLKNRTWLSTLRGKVLDTAQAFVDNPDKMAIIGGGSKEYQEKLRKETQAGVEILTK